MPYSARLALTTDLKKRVLIKQLCTLEPINGVSTVFNGQNQCFPVKKKQSRPSGDHRQVAFAIQLAAHCTFPSPSFGGQGVLSYPPYKKCRASPALVPTDSQKSANRIHTSEGLKLRSWSRKQSPIPSRIPFNDSTISTVNSHFSFHPKKA